MLVNETNIKSIVRVI